MNTDEISPRITICYGPYEANGILRHRVQKLNGLLERLELMGYIITLKKFEHIDRLIILMKGRLIHRSNIRNLQFNISYDEDMECRKIVAIVMEATERFMKGTQQATELAVEDETANVEISTSYVEQKHGFSAESIQPTMKPSMITVPSTMLHTASELLRATALESEEKNKATLDKIATVMEQDEEE